MASRRDQLQSYQFMTQRVISAFVMRETDPAQSPLRRGVGAVFAGLMIAVMIGAGFGVTGILTKAGANTWKTDGAVIVEKESGASYVYQDGVLHPMLNYTSALLAASKSGTVFHEAANSLANTPRGVALGIPGAPNSLPGRDKRLGLPWTVCSAVASGASQPSVTLLIGAAPAGAQSPGTQGLLVNDAADNTYLIWQNHRYLLRQANVVVPALFGAATAVPVGRAWLNALQAGTDIAPISVGPRKGQQSTRVPGHLVGDLLSAQTGVGTQYSLVFDDGIAPLNELQKAIYLGQNAVQPDAVSVAQTNNMPTSHELTTPTGDTAPPTKAPTLQQVSPAQQLCAATNAASTMPSVTVGGSIDQAGPGITTPSTSDTGAALANRIVVPGGHVAVIRAIESPTATTGAYYLVTDQGLRYAVPNDQALAALGYQPTDAVNVLSALVLRVPAGPALDPADAVKTVTATGQTR